MHKNLFAIIITMYFTANTIAQTTILDFESPATSADFQYFGSNLDGTKTSVINNPNATGINTSAKVTKFIKPAVSEVWAGAFTNPNPTTLIDLKSNNQIKIKVWMDHIGNATLKLEGSTDNGPVWVLSVPNTKVNEWEELTFDVALPSIENPSTPAKGFVYSRVVLFFDFGIAGTGTDVISYLDDIIAVGGGSEVCSTVLDFEGPETTTDFQYFGSPLDGTKTSVINNPNPTGINTSSKVTKFLKPAVAEVWAGAFTNPDPKAIIDLVNNSKIRVKVHMDHIGNLALKLEGSVDGPVWVNTIANTKINEWEELEFDVNLPSLEAPNKPAKGFIYPKIVLFFDFGTAGNGTEITYYVDDICQVGSGAPTAKTVNFAVDMNNYSANFDTVYLSGTFNNWSGDGNPLTDDDADGIWTTSINMPVGLYEYKVTLDNWAAEEKFIGTEECTMTTDIFTNRKLVVSANTDVPKFCFNSCYACGEELLITFKLGMGTVVPNPEGVWIAGGGKFDVPGGKYKMSDANGDKVYELVVPRKAGFTSYFTFTNGPCGDYSCKEIIEGQSCANPANFNDRLLNPITGNTVYESCFGICSNNTSCTVGVNDFESSSDIFTLVGNPSETVSTITFHKNDGTKRLWITNNVGSIVQSMEVPSYVENISVNTSDLSSGFYSISVILDNKMQTVKLIKL
jgi:hypothetical protein